MCVLHVYMCVHVMTMNGQHVGTYSVHWQDNSICAVTVHTDPCFRYIVDSLSYLLLCVRFFSITCYSASDTYPVVCCMACASVTSMDTWYALC